MRRSDLLLAVFVVAIAVMLVLPLPTSLLDFLLACNLSFSLLLLFVGLYIPNALGLLTFPSILLLSTLFRLGLNVASTRLILSNGDAGQVISRFGIYLTQDNPFVGAVIFVIITIVNFVVIAKGAGRVSEVAARFALDAMPGKQHTIDSDLRAGLISAPEAYRRREELRKESQLYGSMDGAMRFVQGDAIAGFLITVTNILGGIYLGVLHDGLSIGLAVEKYVRLTIGDGLVSQIPAVLISVCAGVIVTRVSSGENATLGRDLGEQLFRSPLVLIATGTGAAVVAVLSGLTIQFLPVVLLFLFGALVARKQQGALHTSSGGHSTSTTALGPATDLEEERRTREVQLLVHQDLFRNSTNIGSREVNYDEWWRTLRKAFFSDSGLHLPDVKILAGNALSSGSYEFRVGRSVLEVGTLPSRLCCVELRPRDAFSLGFHVLQRDVHPWTQSAVFWTTPSEKLFSVSEAAGIAVLDPVQFSLLQIAKFYRRHPEELIGTIDVHSALKALEREHPGLLTEAQLGEFLTAGRLREVLVELAREGVHVGDFSNVMELIVTYCVTDGMPLVREDEFDVQDIVEFIRLARRKHLLAPLLTSRRTLKVCTMSQETETEFENGTFFAQGRSLTFSDEIMGRLRRGFERVLSPIFMEGVPPLVILCRSDLRPKVQCFMELIQVPVCVVTPDELDTSIRVEPAGVWSIPSSQIV